MRWLKDKGSRMFKYWICIQFHQHVLGIPPWKAHKVCREMSKW